PPHQRRHRALCQPQLGSDGMDTRIGNRFLARRSSVRHFRPQMDGSVHNGPLSHRQHPRRDSTHYRDPHRCELAQRSCGCCPAELWYHSGRACTQQDAWTAPYRSFLVISSLRWCV
ncbi:hypothetical protein LTS18_000261, partial [Coniosporium uncinatum]